MCKEMRKETCKAMRKELLMVVVSTLIGLLLLEGGVRLYYGIKDRLPPHADPATRDEWDWIRTHQSSQIPASEAMAGFDSQLGWTLSADIDSWVRQKGHGLPTGDLTTPTDQERFLFIGDSFTQGLYVEDRENFAWLFGARHHPDAQVLNLGVSGYGPDQMLLLYESIGRRYHPDVVVMGFYVRGLYRAQSKFTYYAKPWFETTVDDALVLHGVPVPAPASLIGEYESGKRAIAGEPYSYLWGALGASAYRLVRERRLDTRDDPQWVLMRAILKRFVSATRADGATPALLIIPSRLEEFPDSVHADLDRLAIAEACLLGIPAISLAPALMAAETASVVPTLVPTFRPRRDGGHLSVRGHEVAAEEIARVLKNSGNSGCPG